LAKIKPGIEKKRKKSGFPRPGLDFRRQVCYIDIFEGAFRRGAGVQGVFLMQST
jgi:hypothetical protein